MPNNWLFAVFSPVLWLVLPLLWWEDAFLQRGANRGVKRGATPLCWPLTLYPLAFFLLAGTPLGLALFDYRVLVSSAAGAKRRSATTSARALNLSAEACEKAGLHRRQQGRPGAWARIAGCTQRAGKRQRNRVRERQTQRSALAASRTRDARTGANARGRNLPIDGARTNTDCTRRARPRSGRAESMPPAREGCGRGAGVPGADAPPPAPHNKARPSARGAPQTIKARPAGAQHSHKERARNDRRARPRRTKPTTTHNGRRGRRGGEPYALGFRRLYGDRKILFPLNYETAQI